MTLLALLPIIAVLVARVGRGGLPVGDVAVIDLRVRDVFTADIPLVGPYSRFHWNHPGPAMFWLIAPLSVVAGRAAWATLVGAAIIQGVAVVAIARLAWIRGRFPLVLASLAALSLAYSATGSWVLLEPWNPYVAFPFFLLFIMQAWFVALGDARRLVGATIVGSFLIQLHVGYAPVVAVVAITVVCMRFLDRKPISGPKQGWRRSAIISLAVAVLMWLPVVVEQLVDNPGNLSRLAHYFLGGRASQPAVGLRAGAGLMAAEFKIPPPWLGGADLPDHFTGTARAAALWWLMVAVALVGVGAFAARRAGKRSERRLIQLASILVAAGIVVISRVTGDADAYLFYWRIQVAVILVLAAGWACWRWLDTGARWLSRVMAAALVGAIAWGSVGLAIEVMRVGKSTRPFEPVVDEVVHRLHEQRLPDAPVLVRYADDALGGLEGGVIDELDRHGYPVRVDRDRDFQFGRHRTADTDDVQSIWYVTESGARLSHLSALPGGEILARSTPLARDEESDAVALQRSLEAQLSAAGRADLFDSLDSSLVAFLASEVSGIDQAAAERLAQLNEKVERSGRCRCAIVAFPPKAAPPRGSEHIPEPARTD